MEGLLDCIVKQIGVGGFGKVYLAQGEDGQKYALKRIENRPSQLENIQREIEAGKRLTHKNITKFVGHFEHNGCTYLVFEYIEGLDMLSLLEHEDYKAFTERAAHKIFLQLLSAVQYCHEQGVINFDIKLDNVMINPTTLDICLIDFGLCDFVTPENKGMFTRRVGSDEYCAPEILMKSDAAFDGSKVDVWTIGAVLYAMLSATFVFDVELRKNAIKDGKPHPELSFDFPISEEAKDLISKMLEVEPSERITLDEVQDHTWVTKL